MKKKNILSQPFFGLLSLILLNFCISFFGGSFANPTNLAWYERLQHPALTPPSWLFGIVWPVLYLFMGFAAWIICKKKGLFSKPLYWYFAQLTLNALYMPLFFGLHLLCASTICTGLLLLSLFKTTELFFSENRYAGLLLIPYCTWTCFAFYLSIVTWYLNK